MEWNASQVVPPCFQISILNEQLAVTARISQYAWSKCIDRITWRVLVLFPGNVQRRLRGGIAYQCLIQNEWYLTGTCPLKPILLKQANGLQATGADVSTGSIQIGI